MLNTPYLVYSYNKRLYCRLLGRLLFKGGVYSRAASDRADTVIIILMYNTSIAELTPLWCTPSQNYLRARNSGMNMFTLAESIKICICILWSSCFLYLCTCLLCSLHVGVFYFCLLAFVCVWEWHILKTKPREYLFSLHPSIILVVVGCNGAILVSQVPLFVYTDE